MVKGFQQAVAGKGFTTVFHYGHFFAVNRMAGDGLADCTAGFGWIAASDCVVDFPRLATGKLSRKGLVRGIVLGNHKATAGILVEAVDDARALNAANAGELAGAVVQ